MTGDLSSLPAETASVSATASPQPPPFLGDPQNDEQAAPSPTRCADDLLRMEGGWGALLSAAAPSPSPQRQWAGGPPSLDPHEPRHDVALEVNGIGQDYWEQASDAAEQHPSPVADAQASALAARAAAEVARSESRRAQRAAWALLRGRFLRVAPGADAEEEGVPSSAEPSPATRTNHSAKGRDPPLRQPRGPCGCAKLHCRLAGAVACLFLSVSSVAAGFGVAWSTGRTRSQAHETELLDEATAVDSSACIATPEAYAEAMTQKGGNRTCVSPQLLGVVATLDSSCYTDEFGLRQCHNDEADWTPVSLAAAHTGQRTVLAVTSDTLARWLVSGHDRAARALRDVGRPYGPPWPPVVRLIVWKARRSDGCRAVAAEWRHFAAFMECVYGPGVLPPLAPTVAQIAGKSLGDVTRCKEDVLAPEPANPELAEAAKCNSSFRTASALFHRSLCAGEAREGAHYHPKAGCEAENRFLALGRAPTPAELWAYLVTNEQVPAHFRGNGFATAPGGALGEYGAAGDPLAALVWHRNERLRDLNHAVIRLALSDAPHTPHPTDRPIPRRTPAPSPTPLPWGWSAAPGTPAPPPWHTKSPGTPQPPKHPDLTLPPKTKAPPPWKPHPTPAPSLCACCCRAWDDSTCTPDSCLFWAADGACGTNPEFMNAMCPEACGEPCPENAAPAEAAACVSWRRTAGCSADGPPVPQGDEPCDSMIGEGASGYCECASGTRCNKVGCDHPVFRCEDCCAPQPAAPIEVERCVSWRATAECSDLGPKGPRVPKEDRDCHTVIVSSLSGYCECVGGLTCKKVGCAHADFRCEDCCAAIHPTPKPHAALLAPAPRAPPPPRAAPTLRQQPRGGGAAGR